MTAIIILNWNGHKDTIECLQSLYASTSDFFAIVMDNGSTDSSPDSISTFLAENGIATRRVAAGDRLRTMPQPRECVLCLSKENLGFAKGNNEALRLLSGVMPEKALLLNNDTIVEPDFLDVLDGFSANHPDVQVLTPMICYASNRNMVWNCGGRLSLGMRKYYFAKERVESVGRRESIPITFVTGCALYFDTKILLEDGGLFTERFFFGEEDFNFCLRMKKERRAMACVPRSKIYHKVSASTANKSNAGKIYIHYLNRFIDMRQNSSAAFYAAWAMANFVYVSLLLGKRKDIGFGKGIRLMRDVLRDSLHKDSVTHADFTQALSRKG